MPRPSVITADQLLTLHDPPWRHELVRGELRTMSPSGGRHGDVSMNLGAPLKVHARARKLGKVYASETGFVLAHDPDTVLAPDLAFVRRDRLRPAGEDAFVEGPPDLAVEVRSLRDSRRRMREKAREWLAHGTRSVWLVDPKQQTVTVLDLHGGARELAGDDVLTDDVVPGFAIPLREIFED